MLRLYHWQTYCFTSTSSDDPYCLSVCPHFQNASYPPFLVGLSWYFNTRFYCVEYLISEKWSSWIAALELMSYDVSNDVMKDSILEISNDDDIISVTGRLINFVFDSRSQLSAASEPYQLPACIFQFFGLRVSVCLWQKNCKMSNNRTLLCSEFYYCCYNYYYWCCVIIFSPLSIIRVSWVKQKLQEQFTKPHNNTQ